MDPFDFFMAEESPHNKLPLKFTSNINKKDNNVLHMDIPEHPLFTDYRQYMEFSSLYHLFSDKVRDVIQGYVHEALFYGVFITPEDHKTQYIYWRMDTDNLKKYSIGAYEDMAAYRFSLAEIRNEPLFCIVRDKREDIGFREDIAEAVMRRCPVGIKFKKLQVAGGA